MMDVHYTQRHKTVKRLKFTSFDSSNVSSSNVSGETEGQQDMTDSVPKLEWTISSSRTFNGVVSPPSKTYTTLYQHYIDNDKDDVNLCPEKITSSLNNNEGTFGRESMGRYGRNIRSSWGGDSISGSCGRWTRNRMVGSSCTRHRISAHSFGSFSNTPNSRMNNEFNSVTISVKVVVIGDSHSGKSSLVHRLVHDEFIAEREPTFGVDFLSKELTIKRGKYRISLNIWDIAGHDSNMANTQTYYQGAKAAFVVYDVKSLPSLVKALEWKKDLDAKVRFDSQGMFKVPAILIGTKCDLMPCPLSLQWRHRVLLQKACYRKLKDLKFADKVNERESIRGKEVNTTPDGALHTINIASTSDRDNILSPLLSYSASDVLREHGDNRNNVNISNNSFGDHPYESAPTHKPIQLPETVQEVQDFINEHHFSGHFFVSGKMGENIEEMIQFTLACVLKMDPLGTDEDIRNGERALDMKVNMGPDAMAKRRRMRCKHPPGCCIQ